MRRRHEAADQGERGNGRHRGRQVQDVRLRQRHRVLQPGHRVAQGQDGRRGGEDQEHGHRQRAQAAAGEDPLLGPGRGCHQGGARRFQREERDRRGRGGIEIAEASSMALSLSETAAKQVKQLKEAQKLPDSVFLRMGVKGGGCSGMSYMLEFDSEKGPHDKEFEIDGVKVVVDKKSYLYLNGTTLDYVTQGLTGGFTFVNPNAKSSCGCGTSFSA